MLAAIEASLTSADKATQLSLSSGFTVPVEAERVLRQAALTFTAKYFEDDLKEGLALLTAAAMLQKFCINTNATKSNTILAEMLRACVTRGINISSEEWHMTCQYCSTAIGVEPLGLYLPPDSGALHPALNAFYLLFN